VCTVAELCYEYETIGSYLHLDGDSLSTLNEFLHPKLIAAAMYRVDDGLGACSCLACRDIDADGRVFLTDDCFAVEDPLLIFLCRIIFVNGECRHHDIDCKKYALVMKRNK